MTKTTRGFVVKTLEINCKK